MEKQIEIRTELCTGCKLCEVACSAVKTGSFSPKDARIKVTLVDIPEIPVPTLLDSCDYCLGDPICVRFCVSEALVWREMEGTPARPRASEAREIARGWLQSVSR